ncbi:DUF6349 family protein [Microtetraspora malaysiensis]|uniref:DUF6349 family protein n=1 Tax=Microtetraspora malaysiensis TaxID=161358 RepID=A0ABW6SNU7_9ACTN
MSDPGSQTRQAGRVSCPPGSGVAGEPRGAVARQAAFLATPRDQQDGMWCVYIGHPGGELGRRDLVVSTAPAHQPTVLHWWGRGRKLKRAGCLGCDWESEDLRRERDAVEAAHDHAWPGWRDLPAVRQPGSNHARWLAGVKRAYPDGWLEAGGPIVTVRADSRFSRHEPGKAPGGGYDLAAVGYGRTKRRARHVQDAIEWELSAPGVPLGLDTRGHEAGPRSSNGL